MLKATAIFVVALIVFVAMNYHHNVILNRITKDSIQKQINKYKEDSCKIVEYEKLRREREQEEE